MAQRRWRAAALTCLRQDKQLLCFMPDCHGLGYGKQNNQQTKSFVSVGEGSLGKSTAHIPSTHYAAHGHHRRWWCLRSFQELWAIGSNQYSAWPNWWLIVSGQKSKKCFFFFCESCVKTLVSLVLVLVRGRFSELPWSVRVVWHRTDLMHRIPE